MAGKRAPCRFRERELARVFRAGKAAGVPVQIHLARDGGLTITLVTAPQDRPQVNEWDEDLAEPSLPVHP